MAIRDKMAFLIDKTRGLIGDPAGTTQQFTNPQIQDALDVYRVYVRYALLLCDPTRSPGGALNYDNFYARVGDWEDDAQLFGPSYQPLTPATADTLTGHWVFNLPNPGQLLPVFVSGQTYDVYGAAADLLLRWAASLARAYNFSANGVVFQRNQQTQELRAMALEYRRMQRPRVIQLKRDDLNSENGYTNAPSGLIGLDW